MLTNVFLQLAIAAGVLFAWLLLLLIIYKKADFGKIVATATVFLVFALSVGMFAAQLGRNAAKQIMSDGIAEKIIAYISSSDIADGKTDGAISDRGVLSKTASGQSADDVLLSARVNVVSGNYEIAAQLYRKYFAMKQDGTFGESTAVGDEYAMLTKLISAEYVSNPAIDGQGGIKVLSQNELINTEASLCKIVSENLSGYADRLLDDLSDEDAKSVKRAADAIRIIDGYYNDMLAGHMNPDRAELENAVDQLKRQMKKNDALASNRYVRTELLRGNVLMGDTESIAGIIDSSATADELVVALELITDGKAASTDFVNVPRLSSEEADAILERIEKIRSEHGDDMTLSEKKLAREVNTFVSSNDNMVVSQLVTSLVLGDEAETSREKSKYYLEAAKAYNSMKTTQKADECIDLALDNFGESEDSEYIDAMEGIVSVMNGDTSVSIIELPSYVSDAVDRVSEYDLDGMAQTEKAKKKAEKDAEHGVDPSGAKDIEAPDFDSYLVSAVTKKRASINIGQIDKSAFPTVGAVISVSDDAGVTENDFKNSFTITDCDFEIKNYSVKKLDNIVGNIVLACDMSGSMSGSDGQLRNAVSEFISTMNKNERVSIVGFTDSIEFDSGFSNDKDTLNGYVSRIRASGGTAVYKTINYALSGFTVTPGETNIIIIMTDGQDGWPAKESELQTTFAALAAEKDCTVYTIGLGSSVDDGYLEMIAEYGNGKFLYVNSAEALTDFYSFIHAQLSNRFYIEFEAIDKIQNERELIVYQNGTSSAATKKYTLIDDPITADNCDDKCKVLEKGEFALYSLSSSYIYKNNREVNLKIHGAGFEKGVEYSVRLKGGLRPTDIKCTVFDSETLDIVIPASIAVGKYTVGVSADGKREQNLTDALTVAVMQNLSHLRFGAYDFTAEKITETNGSYLLSGNVTLNGWLHFKNTVVITGDITSTYSGANVTLTDAYGSYISYDPSATTGFTKKHFADKGVSINIPALGSFRIYGDSYDQNDYASFTVSTINPVIPIKVKTVAAIGGNIALYPDMIYADVFYSMLDLSFFDKLMPGIKETLFSIDTTGKFALTNNAVCVAGKLSVDYNKDADKLKKFQFFSIGLNLKKLDVDLDSITESYSVAAEVAFNAFKIKKNQAIKGIGFSIGWDDGRLDSIELSVKSELLVSDTPVPIYISEMSLGFSGAAAAEYDEWYTYLTRTTISGGLGLKTDDLSKFAPKKVNELFNLESICLAEIPDAKLNILLKEFNLNLSASYKMFGKELGNCVINIGRFDYANELMGINATEYGVGVQLYITALDLEFKNLSLYAKGDVDVVIGYPFSGITLGGSVGYKVSWFIFDFGSDLSGKAGIGFFENSMGKLQFTAMASGNKDNGRHKGFRLDITDGSVNKTRF